MGFFLQSQIGDTPDAAAERKNKNGDQGEEDGDIGDEIPSSNFPPVEIDKDAIYASRSSSSSNSGSDSSSSSDSNSGSSLGSDSDADDAQSPFVGSKPLPES